VSIELLPGERPAVRSLELAQHFGLKHKNVLQDIKNLTAKLPDSFTELNFQPSTYEDPTGRTLPCYLLSRDAFTLLVMGWSSARAIDWKLKYIEAFNSLERAALENVRQEALAEGAGAWLTLPPATRDWLPVALDYHKRGLNACEIAKLMDKSDSAVNKALALARRLGLIDGGTARRRAPGFGRRRKSQGAGA
jgi:Rha family phage regulatory protein